MNFSRYYREAFDPNIILFAFSFSLAMGHTAFTTLADRAVHVLGQLQHFNQICKLFHSKRIVMILSRLVDTFSSRILYPMLLLSGNHSIAVV